MDIRRRCSTSSNSRTCHNFKLKLMLHHFNVEYLRVVNVHLHYGVYIVQNSAVTTSEASVQMAPSVTPLGVCPSTCLSACPSMGLSIGLSFRVYCNIVQFSPSSFLHFNCKIAIIFVRDVDGYDDAGNNGDGLLVHKTLLFLMLQLLSTIHFSSWHKC